MTKRKADVASALTLNAEHIAAVRAVALAASNDEFRGALQALHVVSDGSTVTWEACDAYRLHRAVLDYGGCASLDVMIPAAWLVKALREVTSSGPPRNRLSTVIVEGGRATVTNDVEARNVALTVAEPPKDDATRTAPRCGCGYPNTSMIREKADEGEHLDEQLVGVNPKFFAQVFKAIELFGGDAGAARFKVVGGMTPVRFECRRNGDRFVGMLMPLRLPDASEGGGR
jgi:hypothetical protein